MNEKLKKEYERKAEIMAEMTGVSKLDILSSRHFPCPYCRAIIYTDLHNMGYPSLGISEVSGYNRATVLILMKRLKKIFDGKTWIDEIKNINERYYDSNEW